MYTKLIIVLLFSTVLVTGGCNRTTAICRDYIAERATIYKEDWSKKRGIYYKMTKRKNFNLMKDKKTGFRSSPSRIKDISHILDSIGAVNLDRDTLFCVRIEPETCSGCPYSYVIKTSNDTITIDWPLEDINSERPLGHYKPTIGTLQALLDSSPVWDGQDIVRKNLEKFYKAVFNWDTEKIEYMIGNLQRISAKDRVRVMRIIVNKNKIVDFVSIESV